MAQHPSRSKGGQFIDSIGRKIRDLLESAIVPFGKPFLKSTTALIGFLSDSASLLLRDHYGRSSILTQAEMRPARQTVSVLRHAAEDAEAYTAHETNVDDVPVAEACCAEVHGYAGGEDEVGPRGRGGQESGHEVGQDAWWWGVRL